MVAGRWRSATLANARKAFGLVILSMRRRPAVLIGAIALGVLAACSGDSMPSQRQSASDVREQAVEAVDEDAGATSEGTPVRQFAAAQANPPTSADRALLAPRWPRDGWRPLSRVLQKNAALATKIDAEIAWCSESFALGDKRPRAALLDVEDAPWVSLIAEATAAARGIALDEMPAVWIQTPKSLRVQSCRSVAASRQESNPDRPGARWYWHLALGLIEADWGPSVLGHLRNLDTRGWYLPQPAVGPRPDAGAITLFLNDPPGLDAAETLSHEMIHHLQHQIIDADAPEVDERRIDTDRSAVRHWLLETDAMISMLASGDAAHERAVDLLREAGGIYQLQPSPLFDRLAAEISDWHYGPYRHAEEFAARLLGSGGPERLDELLRDLPDSMEQLLHAEKYDSRELPLDLSSLQPLVDAAISAAEWRRVGAPLHAQQRDQDTLGQYYLQLLISASTRRDVEAAAAAAGWGGDRLHIFLRGAGEQAETLAVWTIAFDDAAEHAEGAAGLREWLIAFSDGEAWGAYGDRVVGWDAPHGALRVLNGGTVVWLLAAPDGESADTIAERLLTANAPVLWAP